MSRILVVEKEASSRAALFDLLQSHGYRVFVENDGASGLARALDGEVDLLLLDLAPGPEELAACAEIRRRLPDLPILLLLPKDRRTPAIDDLNASTDDQLRKPFSDRALMAKVKTLLRRLDGDAAPVTRLSFGDVDIDFTKHTCTRAGNRIALTVREFGVLKLLAENSGEPVSRELFLDVVWASNPSLTTRTVDNQILSLRAKLESEPTHPRHILTVHGIGYRLEMISG